MHLTMALLHPNQSKRRAHDQHAGYRRFTWLHGWHRIHVIEVLIKIVIYSRMQFTSWHILCWRLLPPPILNSNLNPSHLSRQLGNSPTPAVENTPHAHNHRNRHKHKPKPDINVNLIMHISMTRQTIAMQMQHRVTCMSEWVSCVTKCKWRRYKQIQYCMCDMRAAFADCWFLRNINHLFTNRLNENIGSKATAGLRQVHCASSVSYGGVRKIDREREGGGGGKRSTSPYAGWLLIMVKASVARPIEIVPLLV